MKKTTYILIALVALLFVINIGLVIYLVNPSHEEQTEIKTTEVVPEGYHGKIHKPLFNIEYVTINGDKNTDYTGVVVNLIQPYRHTSLTYDPNKLPGFEYMTDRNSLTIDLGKPIGDQIEIDLEVSPLRLVTINANCALKIKNVNVRSLQLNNYGHLKYGLILP